MNPKHGFRNIISRGKSEIGIPFFLPFFFFANCHVHSTNMLQKERTTLEGKHSHRKKWAYEHTKKKKKIKSNQIKNYPVNILKNCVTLQVRVINNDSTECKFKEKSEFLEAKEKKLLCVSSFLCAPNEAFHVSLFFLLFVFVALCFFQ